jgi:hypothetical protein
MQVYFIFPGIIKRAGVIAYFRACRVCRRDRFVPGLSDMPT